MPLPLTYPGVYVEEIPSGVHTIMGVGTSIAAFLGRTQCGRVDTPNVINSYGDFERRYGGLWQDSKLGYAVRDFFLNGGSQAVIVRLFKSDAGDDPTFTKSSTTIKVDELQLIAADPGKWGKNLRASVDFDVDPGFLKSLPAETIAFNLTVQDVSRAQTEQFRNLTLSGPVNKVADILKQSTLVRYVESADALKAAFELQKKLVEARGELTKALADTPSDLKKIEDARKKVKDAQDKLDAKRFDDATLKDGALAKAIKEGGDVSKATDELNKVISDRGGLDGAELDVDSFVGAGAEGGKRGLYALEGADLFNILCIPPYKPDAVEPRLIAEAAAYCERRRAMLLVDPPPVWNTKEAAKEGVDGLGTNSKNAALFFPRLMQPDPLLGGQIRSFAPCGAVAGIFARTDATRGVWKAPAGFEATLVGVTQLSVPLTDGENGELNPLGINCLRTMPAAGRIVWGARTLQGNDRLASEWKYIPVRRTALFIEESLYRGTHWVVFEPNDEPLWAQIRLNVGAFMNDLFRQGAFQGTTPREAYFVKCDKETTTQNDINKGIVNILVGFAPLKPAEFVLVKLQQIAGQIQT